MERDQQHTISPSPNPSPSEEGCNNIAKGQIVIVTGATGSMGAEATRQLAAEGKTVIMACRNTKKAEELRQQILKEQPNARLKVMALELSSPTSIHAFVNELQTYLEATHRGGMEGASQRGLEGASCSKESQPQTHPALPPHNGGGLGRGSLSALFCNAGVKAHRYTLTPDGIEMDFATNYLGNRLLTLLLLPYFETGAHITIMVSLTTKYAHLDMGWRKRGAKDFGQLSTYASSKLALMYFAIGLAKRHPELHVNVADPGIVNSNMISMGRWYDPLADIFFRPFIKTPKQGVYPALQALRSDHSQHYFVGKKHSPIPQKFLDSPLVDLLWEEEIR